MNNLPLPNLPTLNLYGLNLQNLPDLFPDFSDLSRASGSWLATLGVGLAVGLPISGAADPFEEVPAPASQRWMNLDEDDRPPAWMGENVSYKRGVGLEYSRDLKLGETPVELGVGGPILRKKKGAGLTVELRF
jgi:hypothetical protein